jgi:hypothetical protein
MEPLVDHESGVLAKVTPVVTAFLGWASVSPVNMIGAGSGCHSG